MSVSLDNVTAQNYANRIEVFDRLIHHHIHHIESLLETASNIENQIWELNSDYVTQLNSYRETLSSLISSYGHTTQP